MMNVGSDGLIRQSFLQLSIQHSAFNIQLFYYDQEAFHLIYMHDFARDDFYGLQRRGF